MRWCAEHLRLQMAILRFPSGKMLLRIGAQTIEVVKRERSFRLNEQAVAGCRLSARRRLLIAAA